MLLEAALVASACGPTDEVLAKLKDKYGETPAYHAVLTDDQRTQLIITVSLDSKTWTALVEQSKDVACIVAVGDSWTVGRLPDFSEADPDPPVIEPHWPPQWPDGICPCGDYIRGPI